MGIWMGKKMYLIFLARAGNKSMRNEKKKKNPRDTMWKQLDLPVISSNL